MTEAENRIKEQQLDLFGDRLSSTSFNGNQFRVYLSALAHLCMVDIREALLQGTKLAKATAGTIRQKLISVAGQVRISCRRIFLALDSTYTRKGIFFTVYERLIDRSQPGPLLVR